MDILDTHGSPVTPTTDETDDAHFLLGPVPEFTRVFHRSAVERKFPRLLGRRLGCINYEEISRQPSPASTYLRINLPGSTEIETRAQTISVSMRYSGVPFSCSILAHFLRMLGLDCVN
jgi:hypothetical protein